MTGVTTSTKDHVLSVMTIGDAIYENRCTITIVTDVRQTSFGPWNYGHTVMGPIRRVRVN